MSGAEVENDRRQRESCVLMKAKPPTLTLAGWEHIASAADNVRLPTKRAATEPYQADHGPSEPRHMGNLGLEARADRRERPLLFAVDVPAAASGSAKLLKLRVERLPEGR